MPEFDQAFWDERYSAHSTLWSGRPNPHLVGEASGLASGRALDVGCGEGADSIWLARKGWQVTAVDLSTVALRRCAEHAATAGAEIADRIDWQHVDLTTWDAGRDCYDLVSAQYLHLVGPAQDALIRRLAAAVVPGGMLLVVGHHPSDMQTAVPRPQRPDLYFTGDHLVTLLDPQGWNVVTNVAAARSVDDPEGRTVTVHDTVFRARRHG